MLPSASALASRREERVQKAFSVDHHGPGDARLSHRATAIYGEHSDYVRPSHTEMNTRSKRRLEALSRRYPGKLELRAPQGATPVNLRMQALTAARFDDILAHVTFTGTGSRDSRLYPLWDQTRIWDPGD